MFLGLLAFAFIVLIIVLWIMLAVKVANIAKERGESFALYLLSGICLSPATSALVLNLVSSRNESSMKQQIDVISQNMYAAAETLKRIETKLGEKETGTDGKNDQ